ncbi:MAG: DUF1566 domain-containing protein [Treponema sp.]|jgi:TolB-like protein|nr:DUF1566 domain-containing protein [Treponema sp.]
MKKCFLGLAVLVMLVTGCSGGAKPKNTAAGTAENSAASSAAGPVAGPVAGMTLDRALKEAADRIEERIAAGSKIAPLNFTSPHAKFSYYVLDELSAILVESRKLIVVDRKEVDLIRSEFDFQLSGEVSDDSMQALGQKLGAQSIISGTLTEIGGDYRIMIRVLNVQNASVEAQYRTDIANDRRVAALLTGGKTTVAAAAPRQAPSGSSMAQAVVPAAQAPAPAAPPAPTTYKIGGTGPAGGFIFYDKGNSSGGWRYLEAAPALTEGKDLQWSVSGFPTGAKGAEVGNGKLNTRNIMDASVQAAINAPAARLCDRLVYGGYDDWYLPSKNELGLMYMNLKVDGIGGFGSGRYWSSSEEGSSVNYAWSQDFSNGSQDYSTKTLKCSVRACRQF